MKNAGSAFLRLIIGVIVVGVVGYLFTSGTRLLNENNSMQREAKIALDDYIADGRDFPVGEYVSLDARWVIGPFATLTSTSSTNGFEATSGVAYYYFAVLEDGTVMAVKTENREERAALDRMSDWLLSVDGYPMNGETYRLQGKLSAMKNDDIMDIYKSDLMKVFSVSSSDPSVRYLVLDTTQGRESLYLIIVAAVAAVILIIVLFRRSKKKLLEAEKAYDNTNMTADMQNPQM